MDLKIKLLSPLLNVVSELFRFGGQLHYFGEILGIKSTLKMQKHSRIMFFTP